MNIERRKKLGAYYTPTKVTDKLSIWAIRSGNDRVLEPSFGGCNFLLSAMSRLRDLKSERPEENIYGFDIDPQAFKFISEKQLSGGNFFLQDFLDSSIEDNEIKVPVILGNPPYLPIHKLESTYKNRIFEKFKDFPSKIPRRSGLWIYFIAHALQYLESGGRMAWIVPASISFTGYGQSFLETLENRFNFVKLICINERFFEESGTKEKTSILICDGYREGKCSVIKIIVDTLQEGLLEVDSTRSVKDIGQRGQRGADTHAIGSGFRRTRLGELFNIRIGIVIGASKLLTFKNENIENNMFYPHYLYPIVTKGKQLVGLSISREKLLFNKLLPSYLVDGISLEKNDSKLFSSLVNSIPTKVLLNVTFKSRSNLFGYDDYNHPDAFLTFYSQKSPRVILNENRELNSTNSVHRLYLKQPFIGNYTIVKWVSIQLFSGLLKEEVLNIARQYGNNIHKYEPSDACAIPIIMPETICEDFYSLVEYKFDFLCKLIDEGRIETAKQESLDFVKSYVTLSEETTVV